MTAWLSAAAVCKRSGEGERRADGSAGELSFQRTGG